MSLFIGHNDAQVRGLTQLYKELCASVSGFPVTQEEMVALARIRGLVLSKLVELIEEDFKE